MQTEGKSDVLIRTREEFMAEGERLLDLGVISIRDLHTLESKRNIKLAKQKEEQQRIWRAKAKEAREKAAKEAKAAASIRPNAPVENAPQTSTSVGTKSTKVSVPSTACASVNIQSANVSASIRPPQQHGYQSMYMYQPMPQQMSFAPAQMNNRYPISPLQTNVQTNVVPQQNRFPAKPKALPKIPTPNFNKRYVGTVTKLRGNVYCQGLVGEVQLDGKTIYEYCLKEGDGIEFKVKKSRHQKFYKAEDIELL